MSALAPTRPVEPGLNGRLGRTGVPLLVARLLLGGMFVWMGLAKSGYPELALKKAGVWDRPTVKSVRTSGYVELGGPVDFLKLIREYQMFPDAAWGLLNFTAVAIPWIEVLCGLLLIFGVGVRGAAGLLFALLIVFTTMIVVRGLRIHHADAIPFCAVKFNCGCGAGDVLICRKIPENLALAALALFCLFSRATRLCLRKQIIPAAPTAPTTA
ncbi:MAG: DoxX family membrane protein [Planctomycetes bacterium]|nr:DoxX family membrane protein [Planctomycetota bacterium]